MGKNLNGTTSVSDKEYLEVDVDKNNVMKYTSIDKIIDIIKNGTTVTADEKRVYVPLVVFVKDGKIVDYHADTVESQRDPYVALTKEKDELINIYKEGILKVTGDRSCNEKEKDKC